jgi:hypothetical protein
MYLARVETRYTTYALGKTEAEARRLALESADAWLKQRGVIYNSLADIEDSLGCSIWRIDPGTAIQEY